MLAAGQGSTCDPTPWSSRNDCMVMKVVLLVNSWISAAARTPVYFLITGAGCRIGHLVEIALDGGPDVLSVVPPNRGWGRPRSDMSSTTSGSATGPLLPDYVPIPRSDARTGRQCPESDLRGQASYSKVPY
jgi:hypothetical protein